MIKIEIETTSEVLALGILSLVVAVITAITYNTVTWREELRATRKEKDRLAQAGEAGQALCNQSNDQKSKMLPSKAVHLL